MYDQLFTVVDSIGVLNIIDPLKTLSSIAPGCINMILALKLLDPLIFFPDAGKAFVLQYDHKIPAVLATLLHDWPIGV
jgi:hypothetical protein